MTLSRGRLLHLGSIIILRNEPMPLTISVRGKLDCFFYYREGDSKKIQILITKHENTP